MENKLESRIDILDRLSIKYGKHFEVESFEELIKLCDSMTVIIVVRLAMAEYERQTTKTMYSKNEVGNFINQFWLDTNTSTEFNREYRNSLTVYQMTQKWIEEKV